MVSCRQIIDTALVHLQHNSLNCTVAKTVLNKNCEEDRNIFYVTYILLMFCGLCVVYISELLYGTIFNAYRAVPASPPM
jgi:hypothetical protein